MKIEQRIELSFAFPVVFTHGLFDPENDVFAGTLRGAGRQRAACYVDANVLHHHPGLADRVSEYFRLHATELELAGAPVPVPGGEAAKNDFGLIESVLASMLDRRLDRHSYVVAIGGGAVLDAVGFAAALVHRGLRLVRVPTTVLSQNDGGVGVKNGINFHGTKNALGTFAPPFAVLNDLRFLDTLPDREWRAGAAEAFKVAIIRDRAFFDWLCENARHFPARDSGAMEQLVMRCAEGHLEHIRTSGDPFELGRARPLDFGHWAAHKLELLSDFRIAHGEAVAVGIALDSIYAAAHGWLSADELARVLAGLAESGLPLWFPELEDPALFDGLREFREHLGGELCVTFPRGIGARHEVREVEISRYVEAIAELKRRSPPC